MNFIINDCVVLMPYGSTLYGTATKNSDKDCISVYMPKYYDILTCKPIHAINKTTGNNDTKNNKDDIDVTIYSLHKFIELASKGETVAMDMLHAPNSLITYQNSLWRLIIGNRTMFYTKQIKSYMGYIKKQTYKYCLKGDRLKELESAISFLSDYPKNKKLSDVWNQLPLGEYNKFIKINDDELYQVCNLKYNKNCKIETALSSLSKRYSQYGNRAHTAMSNDGIDWKALSHAVRYSIQLIDLYNDGFMTLPLKLNDRNLVFDIKTGNKSYDSVIDILENNVELINDLSDKSTFPEFINTEFWDSFLEYVCVEYYKNNNYETESFEVSNERTKQISKT